ncbi:MAG: hypothetical protein ABI564_09660 [Ideonella sp.]
MNPNIKNLLPIAALLAGFSMPAGAASSAASSASDSVTASVGSLSGSLVQSSNSSSKGGQQVADGDYRIIEIARDADRPDSVRLKLVATAMPANQLPAGNGEPASFELIVPQQVVFKTGLIEGATINARQRPYGLEFAEGQPRRAFFLALRDEWYRELKSTPVSL